MIMQYIFKFKIMPNEKKIKNMQMRQSSIKVKNCKDKIQRQHFHYWLNECVEFAPLYTISLQELYSNYCHFIDMRYRTVPFSKKFFSINLKLTFEKKIQDTEVVFFTRSRVFIRGIKLTEFEIIEK